MTDIGNASMPNAAKYYAIAGKEFGEMAAVEVAVVRAPLWTKIIGASQVENHHLAKSLRDSKIFHAKLIPTYGYENTRNPTEIQVLRTQLSQDDILALSIVQ
jgi:hypothetical protein